MKQHATPIQSVQSRGIKMEEESTSKKRKETEVIFNIPSNADETEPISFGEYNKLVI